MANQAMVGNIVSTISDANTFNNESGFNKFAAGVDAAKMGIEGLSHYATAFDKLVPGVGIAALSASLGVDFNNIVNASTNNEPLTKSDKLTMISDGFAVIEQLAIAGAVSVFAPAYAPIVGAAAIGFATAALYSDLGPEAEAFIKDQLSSIFSHIDSDSAQKSLDMITEYYKLNKEMNFSSKYDVLLDNPDIGDKLMLGQEVSVTKDMLNKYGLDANSFGDLLGSINNEYNPIKFDFDSFMHGGGIPQSIIPNYTPTQYDPITLDLDGDGIETVGLSVGVMFDHSADGTKNATGWVSKDDGLLVLDRNGNGTIDSGKELFGDNTILSNGQKAKDGYAALADLDNNGDSKIDATDAAYTQLHIWQDSNQDGISQVDNTLRNNSRYRYKLPSFKYAFLGGAFSNIGILQTS